MHDKERKSSSSDALRSGLVRRNISNAITTVFGNFREYCSFFVAIFIMQSLLWLVCFTTVTNVTREREVICGAYDYHLEITQLTQADYVAISNLFEVKDAQTERYYESYKWLLPDDVRHYYTLRVRLGNGYNDYPESVYFYQRVTAAIGSTINADGFISYYLGDNGIDISRVQIDYTPLYGHDLTTAPAELGGAIWLCVLLGLIFVALLVLLFELRLNHYKFTYGIYMTCGAGSRRLFGSSILEVMVIACTTLLASLGFSAALCAVIFDGNIVICWWMIPLILLINAITVGIAVYAPIKRLASRPPVELIVAQDNSNMVSSPRRSLRIFNKSFPYHYELFSVWRFRGYLARLLVGAVMFAAIFICGIFISGMNYVSDEAIGAEYIVKVDVSDVDPSVVSDSALGLVDIIEIMDDAQREAIYAVDGVDHTVWTERNQSSELTSHMLITRDMHSSSKYTVSLPHPTDEYRLATNYFAYSAMDEYYIDTLCRLYEVEGDPYRILNDASSIIISDSVYGEACFSFVPGDTVCIGKYVRGKLSQQDYMQLDDNEILKKMLEKMMFVYEEYTVAAVVHGLEAEKGFVVGMSWQEYLKFTGRNTISGAISVYVNPEMASTDSEKVLLSIRRGLNSYLGDYGIDYKVANCYAALYHELASERGTYIRTVVISLLLLLLSPVVWMFSQLLFYSKRENEMQVLRMLGAKEGRLRRLYSFAGLLIAAMASAVAVLLSYGLSYLLFKLLNSWLPSMGFIESMNYVYSIPAWAVLVAVAVSMVCGYLSSMIPYYVSRKKMAAEAARQAAGNNDARLQYEKR